LKEADSRIWWATIEDLAKNFVISLNKKGNKKIRLDDKKLESAFEMYEQNWWAFKKQVYGENAEEERIDRHKIISLYILSFLAKKPFVKVNSRNKCVDYYLSLANELFCLAIMQILLSAWNSYKFFSMNKNEKKWFLILLNNFKTSNPSNVEDILSLSQAIYYIEKSCRASFDNNLAMLQAKYSKTKTKNSLALRTKLETDILAEFQAKNPEKFIAKRSAKLEKYMNFINAKNVYGKKNI